MGLQARELEEVKQTGCSALFSCRFMQNLLAKDTRCPIIINYQGNIREFF
jgi:hypothetical protein